MDDLSAILASIFSSGTFNEMLRRAAHHAAPHIRGAGEGHAVDQRTFCQRRTDDRSLAGDHVERPV